MAVPRIAKTRIDPMFWKKFPLCKLYPDSKMIGGRRTKKNMVGEKASILFVSCSGRVIMIRPTTAPRKTEIFTIKTNYYYFFSLKTHPLQETQVGNETSL